MQNYGRRLEAMYKGHATTSLISLVFSMFNLGGPPAKLKREIPGNEVGHNSTAKTKKKEFLCRKMSTFNSPSSNPRIMGIDGTGNR